MSKASAIINWYDYHEVNVWETEAQRFLCYLSNMQNTGLINNSRTAWPTRIVMSFFSFLDNLFQHVQDANISFQNMLNFGLGTLLP